MFGPGVARLRWFCPAVWCAVVAACGQTAVPPSAPAPVLRQRSELPASVPTIRVNARLVVLDVVATGRHGEPITGLSKSEFHLSDDDTPQTLTGFMENAPMMQPVRQMPLPPNTFTNRPQVVNTDASTIILLDATQSSPQELYAFRRDVVAFLKEAQPNSSIAIFQIDTQLRMVHGITTDTDALIKSVQDFRISTMAEPIRRASLIPELRDSVPMIAPQEALAEISRYAAGFPGRKNLLWFGGGGTDLDHSKLTVAFPALRGLAAPEEGRVSEVLTLNRTSVYPVLPHVLDKSGAGGFGWVPAGPAPLLGRIESAYHPTIPDAFHVPNEPDLLPVERLARDTGGRIFYGTPKAALEAISYTRTHYYTLSYTPTRLRGAAEHALKVTVDRPGVKLEYRVSYRTKKQGVENVEQPAPAENAPVRMVSAFAPIPDNRKLDEAMDLSRIDATQILFDAMIQPSAEILKDRGANGAGNYMSPRARGKGYRKYSIRFAPEVGMLHLSEDPDGHFRGSVDYVAAVYDADEKLVDGVIKHAPMDFTREVYEQALRYGIVVNQTIAIPAAKGQYFLRLGVRDLGGDTVGTLQVPVNTIPMP